MIKAGLLGLVALLSLSQVVRADDAAVRKWTLGGAVVRLEQIALGDDHHLLTIRADGMLMYAGTAAHIDFITSDKGSADTPKLVPITSAEASDLVIESFSGGAHCCFSIRVMTLGLDNVVSQPVDLRDAGAALFPLPGGKQFGLRSADEAYAYRWTSFAASPAPELLLRYTMANGFSLAGDQMKKPAPSADELNQMAAKMRVDPAWKSDGLPTPYLQGVLDLVYSGNLKAAQDYAVKAWPDDVSGRQDFIDDLMHCALPSSPWWSDVAALNGIQPYEAGKDCKSEY